jgi:hypothetical protein
LPRAFHQYYEKPAERRVRTNELSERRRAKKEVRRTLNIMLAKKRRYFNSGGAALFCVAHAVFLQGILSGLVRSELVRDVHPSDAGGASGVRARIALCAC